jgi:formamidase
MKKESVIAIDPSKRLAEEPATGHNRWHEAILPIAEVEPGQVVWADLRDGFDGQIGPGAKAADLMKVSFLANHPLTGPIYVKGATPGDLLEVKIHEIEADPFEQCGSTAVIPGFGLLRDTFPEPYIVHWTLNGNKYAESEQLPRVRIRCQPFCGVAGVAPNSLLRQKMTARETSLADRGGVSMLPNREDAVPNVEPIASEGLRTIPSRENGGNIDIKQLTPGASLLLPVFVPGALFSVGDPHYAQGDGESCGTAIEMRGRVRLRFKLHKGDAERRGIRNVQFFRDEYFAPPELATPRRFFGTSGVCVTRDGNNECEDLTLAARNALLNMISHLETRGFTPQQAYTLCSVAVDLRVSQAVNLPNVLVTAILPLDIFL